MATYAISDLHLSFGVDKPMNVFGKVWDNYEQRIKEDWIKNIKEEDTVVIPGDISWGISLKEALDDFKYINDLPGEKIILRGNHDYYFSTKTKLDNFLKENNITRVKVLHNNAYDTPDYIICGTRAWGKTENSNATEDKKIILREENRLKLSLNKAIEIKEEYNKKGIDKKILVALHFPPFNMHFQKILEEYKIDKCIYGHLHGYGHLMVKEGNINNIEYKMVSCDYTGFKLIKL